MSDGKRGLYVKYSVTDDQGHDVSGEWFILRPDRDPHAKAVAEVFPDVLARHRGHWTVRKVIAWYPAIGSMLTMAPSYGDPLPDAVALPVADAHVRVLLSAYAGAVETENPTLAADLRAMCARAYLR